MATFRKFEEIEAWQMGRVLVSDVYAVTKEPPFSADYGLKDQIRRAAVSICSNIAEGFERRGNKEFVKFLWIAKGSAAEVCSQLYHARDLGYVSQEMFTSLYGRADGIAGRLFNLIKVISVSEKGLDYSRC